MCYYDAGGSGRGKVNKKKYKNKILLHRVKKTARAKRQVPPKGNRPFFMPKTAKLSHPIKEYFIQNQKSVILTNEV